MPQLEKVLEAALALEPTERARVAREIVASLDGPPEVEPGLANEIQRRIHEIDSKAVKAIPWSEVKARIADRIASRRRVG